MTIHTEINEIHSLIKALEFLRGEGLENEEANNFVENYLSDLCGELRGVSNELSSGGSVTTQRAMAAETKMDMAREDA